MIRYPSILPIRTAQLLLDKKVAGQKHYGSFAEIAAAMVEEEKLLLKKAGLRTVKSLEPEPKRSRSSSSVLMDPSGRVIDQAALMSERGITVGVYVKSEKACTSEYAVVDSFTPDGVKLSDPHSGTICEVEWEPFKKDWSVVMNSAEVKEVSCMGGGLAVCFL